MNYYFCIGWDDKVFSKYIKKNFDYDVNVGSTGGKTLFVKQEKGAIIIIWTRRDDKLRSYLVHECVHAATMTLEKIQWTPDLLNDEVLAYLVEAIFRRAVNAG